MRFIALMSAILLISQSGFAWEHGPLKCEGLYGVIGHLDKVSMETTKEDVSSIVLEGAHDKYSFKVEWNYQLDTLYTFISVDNAPKFQVTMRVPTENHNDSFGEFRDQNDYRLGITCAFEKVKP